MAHSELLIAELLAVNAFATCSIELCKVTSLGHEVRDDTMEDAVLKVKHFAVGTATFLTSAETAEVFSSARAHILEELEHDCALGLVSDADIEINARVIYPGE